MNPIKTGAFIRTRRKALNYSQATLAELLGVEPQTVSKWERGLGMPDYDNLEKLRDIFGCNITDLLEPEIENCEENDQSQPTGSNNDATLLPVIANYFNGDSNEKQDEFNPFDFLNKRKIKEFLERLFGYEYANTFNKNFLFKNLLKRRTKDDYENTLTQGMFRNKLNRNVIGIEAPWLYFRVLIFMLICSAISLISAIMGFVMPFIVICGLLSCIPLLTFLFESNFSRNLSIFEVFIMFIIGGLTSILLTLVTSPMLYQNEILLSALIAPVFEEVSKAFVAVLFISVIKPKNMLTGMLIGFAVGAGFDFFENIEYAFNAAFEGVLEALATGSPDYISIAPIATIIIIRTLFSFFSGHHYFTAIFAAVYVLFKKNASFDAKELFAPKPMIALLVSILLHSLWNASQFVENATLSIIMKIADSVMCISSLLILINIGISQTKLADILEEYQSE